MPRSVGRLYLASIGMGGRRRELEEECSVSYGHIDRNLLLEKEAARRADRGKILKKTFNSAASSGNLKLKSH